MEQATGRPALPPLPSISTVAAMPVGSVLMDLPSAVLNIVVKFLHYKSLPLLRLVSRDARDVVDGASDGWLLKPSELCLLK